jgi:glycosyltransferase involved in cell wall biosynthesis
MKIHGKISETMPAKEADKVRPIYFYPHGYMRDRQIDTVRSWPDEKCLNKAMFVDRVGAQVQSPKSTSKTARKFRLSRLFYMLNLKRRPLGIPDEAVLYVWGGIPLTGKFIVELDNPYCLMGYNFGGAMKFYSFVLRRVLLSRRCIQIRCISEACRNTLATVLGSEVSAKASVVYPKLPIAGGLPPKPEEKVRFLFVSTQFEIKGGAALLRAFEWLYAMTPNCTLDIVTHLPDEYRALVEQCPGIRVHDATYRREQIWERFMSRAHVLIHPTYADSFGMVALEALAHGMAVIVTDVYALKELVVEGKNGFILRPPISFWDGVLPGALAFVKNPSLTASLTSTVDFEQELVHSMLRFTRDLDFTWSACNESRKIFVEKFEAS